MLLASGTRMNSRTAPSTSPTPQPPPETTTMRPSSGRPSARRACCGQRGCRNSSEISGRTSCTLPRPAIRSTERERLAVHDHVHVDARLRPEEQTGQVGDRCDRRARDLAGAPQPRQHDRDGRISRDDHVGIVLGDRARERTRAQPAEQARGDRADRPHVVEQAVDERVRPRHEAQLHAVAVLDDRSAARGPSLPARRSRSPASRLGRVVQLRGERARGRRMALSHIG